MATMAKMFSPAPARQPRYPWFRLDMLMDGIFAIAATLLVLDLKVPANLRPGHLGTALLHLWPEYLVYALGFLQIMAGWLSTRRISAWTKNVDHYATVGMLLGIGMFTLTPFTTAVLAASIHNRADFGSAARLYALVLIVTLLLVGSTAFYLGTQRGCGQQQHCCSATPLHRRQYLSSLPTSCLTFGPSTRCPPRVMPEPSEPGWTPDCKMVVPRRTSVETSGLLPGPARHHRPAASSTTARRRSFVAISRTSETCVASLYSRHWMS
jgi:uncharacterized membrane protein